MSQLQERLPLIGLGFGYLAGAVPFSNLVAQLSLGIDLRDIGTGSVTPTNLYSTGGIGLALVAGVFEVGKGIVGPVVVGSQHPFLAALAGSLAVTGHNWSPFLRGAGGRGLSPAAGALLVVAPPGALVLLGGLVMGSLIGSLVRAMTIAMLAVLPVTSVAEGWRATLAAAIVITPVLAKTVVRRL